MLVFKISFIENPICITSNTNSTLTSTILHTEWLLHVDKKSVWVGELELYTCFGVDVDDMSLRRKEKSLIEDKRKDEAYSLIRTLRGSAHFSGEFVTMT